MIKNLLKIIFILLLLFSCAGKKVNLDDPPEIIPEKEEDIPENMGSPFYPLKESMDDLQFQINELKARVTEYESTLHAPNLNSEILKLIKVPHLKHEVTMNNGTVIQGSILQEDSKQLVVQTRIGQLKIDKTFVVDIQEVKPLEPEIEINEDSVEEKISKNNFNFSGKLVNNGGRRGDFVRVVYSLWENDTKLIMTDSSFISGNSVIYSNGVISDACLDPGEVGTYNVIFNVPDSLNVTYWTKEVKFNIFE